MLTNDQIKGALAVIEKELGNAMYVSCNFDDRCGCYSEYTTQPCVLNFEVESGHPFDQKNTYLRPSGGRGCRQCKRDWQIQKRAA